MKLPEPVAWRTEDHLTDRSATTYSKDMVYRWKCKGWPTTPMFTESQLREALAQQEAVMRQALDALTPIHHGNMTPMAENAWKVAIKALEEVLK